MVDVIKISQMVPADPLDGSEILPIVQAGDNKKTTAGDLAALAGGGAVESVNGEVGVVVIDSTDVPTDPAGQTATLILGFDPGYVISDFDSDAAALAYVMALQAIGAATDALNTHEVAPLAHEHPFLDLGNQPGAVALDAALYESWSLVATGNVALTVLNLTKTGEVTLLLRFAQDAVGGHTLDLSGLGALKTSGALTTTPNAVTEIAMITRDVGVSWSVFLTPVV